MAPRSLRTLIPIAALAVVAAGARPARADTTTAETLWRLAPWGARAGVVVTPPAVAALLTDLRLARDALRAGPRPALAAALEAAMRDGNLDLLDAAAVRARGIDLTQGFAMFQGERGGVVTIVAARSPRAAAAAFVDRQSQPCRVVGRFIACAPSAALLADLGKNDAFARAADARPPWLRGEIEASVALDDHGVLVAAIDVDRGELELRMRMTGADLAAVRPIALPPSPLLARVDAAPVAGAVLLDARPLLALIGARATTSDARAQLLLSSLRGDVAGVALAGQAGGWLRVGVKDADAGRAAIEGCAALSVPPLFYAEPRGDACRLRLVIAPGASMSTDVRLDGDTLVGELGRGAVAATGTPAPRIRALLAQPWLVAAWGRGLGAAPPLPPWVSDDAAALIAWGGAHVDELGVGLRLADGGIDLWLRAGTVWRNPDEIVAKLEPLLRRFADGHDVHDQVVALARRFPKSPLAEDVAAGSRGLLAPVLLLGLGSYAAHQASWWND